MIVPMHKVFCAAQAKHREPLLKVLGKAGVIHLQPVDPQRAVGDAVLQRDITLLDKALLLLAEVTCSKHVPDHAPKPVRAAREAIELHGRRHECEQQVREHLTHMERLGPWGKVRLDDLAALDNAGAELRLYRVRGDAATVDGACVTEVGVERGAKVLAVIVRPEQEPKIPEGATRIPRPREDWGHLHTAIETLRDEIRMIDERLGELAHLRDKMAAKRRELEARQRWQRAENSGLDDPDFFALQGWVPEDEVDALHATLDQSEIATGLTTRPPREDEQPPTLVRYPWWARPIKGLFDMMGTVAGYREQDVSPFFIIALPIFAAILISDAGYGVLLLALILGWRKKVEAGMGKPFVNLALIIGVATVIWGAFTNAFFGFPIYGEGNALIPVDMSEGSRALMMRVSFWIAAVHLSLAWLWQAVIHWPSQKALAPFGWALCVWGMLGVVLYLLLGDDFNWQTPFPYLLIVGVTLVILFHDPRPNPLLRVASGLGSVPLEILGKFSDEISYVRLMAVGLASSVLAVSFNEMAFGVGAAWPIIFVLGHLLNFGLCMIALFAHGVRLNMLEFSNNLGMAWSGYAYDPFAHREGAGLSPSE